MSGKKEQKLAHNDASSSANLLSCFLNILAAPTTAFEALKPKPRLLWPLLAVIFVQASMVFYYYQVVDFDWLMEQFIVALPSDVPAQSVNDIVESQRQMGTTMLGIISAVSVGVLTSVILLLFAGYLSLVSLARGDGGKFSQWFALACWSSVPAIVVGLTSIFNIMLSDDGRLLQEEINPLTLNNLFFDLSKNEPGASFLNSIDVSALWFVGILIVGYRIWSGNKNMISTFIILAPLLLFYSVFAYFSFS